MIRTLLLLLRIGPIKAHRFDLAVGRPTPRTRGSEDAGN